MRPTKGKAMTITWSEWEKTYKPVRHPRSGEESMTGWMFETFGEDLEYVQTKAPSKNHIWTLVDNNPNSVYLDIESGFWLFNRMGYFITEVPWTEDVLVSNDPSYREE